jgi:outer membrane protein
MIMQRRKLMLATAATLLLIGHSATAQSTDSLHNQIADSLVMQKSSGAATVYTIQQCIDSALKSNVVVKTADFTAQGAKYGYLQQIGNMLPSLSGGGQFYNSGGKSVNSFNNTYITENYNQGNAYLQGSFPLWNAGSIQNFIRQYSLAYRADKKDLQYQKDLMTITIILDYFNVLSAEEQLALAEKQMEDTRQRVLLMQIQDSLGAITPTAFTDQKGQLNTSQLTVVIAKNMLETNKLKLSQDMNIPYSPNLDVAKMEVAPTPVIYDATVDQIYQNATKNIAAIEAAELHVASATKAVQATRGNMAPALYLTYQVYTQYSSAATSNALLNNFYGPDGSYVTVNGAQLPVYSQQANLGPTKGVPFNTQFKNNVYTSFGLQLNVPILNHLSYRVLYKQSRVALDQWLFNQKTVNNTLRQAVESAYVTMMQAFRTYNVTYNQVQNYDESFRAAKIRYDAGAIASLDFVIYNTNKNAAELSLIQAKYNYLLETKILDYYQGHLSW